MTIYDDQPLPGYRIEIGGPDDFAHDFPAIYALLERRGHVKRRYLLQNLPRAQIIAIGRHGEDVVSICVLKGPNPEHNATIKERSGYPLDAAVPELGYAATDEHHTRRGLGTRLNQEILNRAGDSVYATVRIPNEDEERNLARCGFRAEGNAWKGDGDYQVRLWVRTMQQRNAGAMSQP